MKIFLSFLQSPIKHPIPVYDFWQYYMKNGIEEAGHEWLEHSGVDWAKGLVPQRKADLADWKEETWAKTIDRLKEQPVDLFLSYLYPEQIDVGAIKEIKKLGIPCVNFFCDNVRQFTSVPSEYKVFDLNWVPEYKAVKMYQGARYPFINMPMPMWIRPELRTTRNECNRQITFIGSNDLQRVSLLKEVVKKAPEINLKIYGNGWIDNNIRRPISGYSTAKKIAHQVAFLKQQGVVAYMRRMLQRSNNDTASDALLTKIKGNVDFDTYNNLTAQSMITLGINRYPSFRYPINKPDTYSRLRDIEAPMLGACYLTEYTEGLENLYEIDKEIAVYKNADDLIEKVSKLSNDDNLRKVLRTQGQKRALTHHSIPQSLKKIIARLKQVGNH